MQKATNLVTFGDADNVHISSIPNRNHHIVRLIYGSKSANCSGQGPLSPDLKSELLSILAML